MRYTRFELGFPRHRKVHPLSDAAFRLWVTAVDYAREQRTDGYIGPADLDALPRCPPGSKKRDALVKELTDRGLWEPAETGGWFIHDFLDWQDSAEQVAKARNSARERMRTVRANRSLGSDDVRANTDERSREVPNGPSSLSLDSGSSSPDPNQPKDLTGSARESEAGKKKPDKRRWRRFPQDFKLEQRHFEYAKQHGVADLRDLFQDLLDHEFKDPKSDAEATLRTWIRRQKRFGGGAAELQPTLSKTPADLERERKNAAEIARRDAVRREELLRSAANAEQQVAFGDFDSLPGIGGSGG